MRTGSSDRTLTKIQNEYIKRHYGAEWQPMHDSCTINISQRQYFDTFWAPDGRYGVKEHGAVQGYKDMVLSPWEQGKMTLEAVVPVKGVPFCDETRCSKIFTIKQKNDKQTVIEMEAHTPDVPYGQTFRVRESWLTA